MFKNKSIIQAFAIAAICAGLSACGGGGGESGSDPVAYNPTTPGTGSTVTDAETSGTIQYAHYNAVNTAMNEAGYATSPVTATVSFNATSKAGSIQFPVLGGSELISTTDGYVTSTWSGPFTTGAYKFNGNILMGCNTSAAIATEATKVLVSTSLERIQGAAAMDALHGLTFDVIDCASQTNSLKFNTDGTLTMSMTKSVVTQNEVINMLNPEKFGGALIDGRFYAGHVFRFGKNGVNKYAIVMQTMTTNIDSKFRYMLAVQR